MDQEESPIREALQSQTQHQISIQSHQPQNLSHSPLQHTPHLPIQHSSNPGHVTPVSSDIGSPVNSATRTTGTTIHKNLVHDVILSSTFHRIAFFDKAHLS